MRIESVRELKEELFTQQESSWRIGLLRGLSDSTVTDAAAVRRRGAWLPPTGVSLGIAVGETNRADGYRLAVRVQDLEPTTDSYVSYVCGRAAQEVDLTFTGPIRPLAQARARKARISSGCSIGIDGVDDAGTLGFFAKDGSKNCLVSCNHVIGVLAGATQGHFVTQPGPADKGTRADAIATFVRAVKLNPKAPNKVDAALAHLNDERVVSSQKMRVVPSTQSLEFLDEEVWKVGRTTRRTTGKLTSVELDNVVVPIGGKRYRFDGQLEISPRGSKPFAEGGDSGAVVLSGSKGLGLLFAGNGRVAYANPLQAVLESLRVSPM